MAADSDLYSRNLEALIRRGASGLVAHLRALPEHDGYRACRAADGGWALRVERQDGTVIDIDDPVSPSAEAERFIPDLPPKTYFFVVFGIGIGHLLFAAARRYPESRFLIVEHDARIFREALRHGDFTPYIGDPRFEFLVSLRPDRLNWSYYHAFKRNDNDRYLPALQIIKNDRIVAYSRRYYEEAAQIFNRSVATYWNLYVGEDYHDALKGLVNVLANLELHRPFMSFEPYRNAFRGKAGIVVSSGPSLDNKIDDLRRIAGRAVIVSADSCFRKLVANGVIPFGTACIERTDITLDYYTGFDVPGETILFAPPVVRPETLAAYRGKVCILYRQAYPFLSLPPLLPLYHLGLCVSHLAYHALVFLGCTPIALVGQDLAYDRRTRLSHFDGMARGKYTQHECDPAAGVTAPDNAGGVIYTTGTWLGFRDILQDLIAANRNHHEVLNVIESDRGLAIRGTRRVEPADFFEGLMRTEPFRPECDTGQGLDAIASRREEYLAAMEAWRLLVLDRLPPFLEDLEGLTRCLDAEAYFEARARLEAGLPPEVLGLFTDLAKPHTRKFDANAASLWDAGEFRARIPEMISLWRRIGEDLLRTLEKSE